MKELKIMKALRYILIVVSMLSVLNTNAQVSTQDWGKLPDAQMQSTSVMVGSGSTLPCAAANGAVVTGSTLGAYSPASPISSLSGPRKGSVNPGGEPGPDEGDNSEPWEDPIGDAMWPLAILACAYLLIRAMRRKRA